jgi:DNA processing protein
VICIHSGDALYPPQLEDVKPAVRYFYAIGDVGLLSTRMASVVGTRDATHYGLRIARLIATSLAGAGVTIVSGLARGIDAAAHRAALECGGKTIAVMGTGADVPYPENHRSLHETICHNGLVISEYEPGSRGGKGSFPRRNRIIAGLGKCTIVVEAGFTSGAQITAKYAQTFGRALAAVPGSIESDQSSGTNLLLRDGAVVITSVEDALSLAGVVGAPQQPPLALDGNDALIWSALGPESLDVDILATRTGLSARDCLASVTSLELNGMVECLITGEVRRR